MQKILKLALLIAAVAAFLACTADSEPADSAPKDTIVFNNLGWDSASTQNHIAQYIVEKGYGYPTGNFPAATEAAIPALRRGDSDVMMELWLPNAQEAWDAATEAGEAVSLGESMSKLSQSAFIIPAYVQYANPGLDSIEDLKEEQYRSLFATPDSGGKAVLMTCPDGWACEVVNEIQVNSYGLYDHVRIVVPESEADLHNNLFDAYEKGEPWLGYLDTSMLPWVKLDLVRLEEPSYSDECWASDKACAYDETTLLIAVRPQILMRAPEVAEMLQKWDLSFGDYASMSIWRSDNDGSYADAAIWWMKNNPDVWGQWVTEEAADAIQDALDGNERAEGWPN